MIIQDQNGDDVTVFCREVGGMIEAMVRAPDKKTFDAVALSVGLIDERGSGLGGIDVCRIGPVLKTAAVVDEFGVEVTAAVYFTDYHVNLKLGASAVSKGAWKKWAIAWTQNGSPAVSHRTESGKTLNNVTLIDPDSVSSPSVVWG